MRILTLFLIALLVSCTERITIQNIDEFLNYHQSLESVSMELREQIMPKEGQLENFLQNMGRIHDPADSAQLERVKAITKESFHFSQAISAWKSAIFEKTGGIDPNKGATIPINWHAKIRPAAYRPSLLPDTLSIAGEKSVLISLIELSNVEIKFLTNQVERINQVAGSVQKTELSKMLLVDAINSPYDTLVGLQVWSVNYFPIDSLLVNGNIHRAEGKMSFPINEWNEMTKESMKIEVPMHLNWGDTTFVFTYGNGIENEAANSNQPIVH